MRLSGQPPTSQNDRQPDCDNHLLTALYSASMRVCTLNTVLQREWSHVPFLYPASSSKHRALRFIHAVVRRPSALVFTAYRILSSE